MFKSPPFLFKPSSRVILFIEHLPRVGKSAMQMESWWLLLSSCSSWCTRRRWWRTRPLARLCWRSRLPIQTWELTARSPTPCTVPTQTSSTSTRDRVRRRLFGVRTQARSPERASLSADSVEAAPAQRAQNIFITSPFIFFSPAFSSARPWHPSHSVSVKTPDLCFSGGNRIFQYSVIKGTEIFGTTSVLDKIPQKELFSKGIPQNIWHYPIFSAIVQFFFSEQSYNVLLVQVVPCVALFGI